MKFSNLLVAAALGTSVNACLLPHELEAETKRHVGGPLAASARRQRLSKRQRADPDLAIGEGDRFSGGSVVPKGLSTEDRDLESVLNVEEVKSGLQGLGKEFGDDLKLFTAPEKTYNNRSLYGAVIGDNPRSFIMSGIHARERGGPDDVLYFVSDLLHAKQSGDGLTYGSVTYTNKQVQTVLDTGFVFVPLVNPDGVAYDQTTDSCWRKNRNPKSARGISDVGIDLNRNFDFIWDYTKAFNQNADISAAASDEPSSEIFHGTGPFSEPETQNVKWVMDNHANLSWFLDLHSFGGTILYGWGDDNMQNTDTAQNFTSSAYDGKRGFLDTDPEDSQYREYITKEDQTAQKVVSERMQNAMLRAGPTPWLAQETVNLYPTSGASTDYALARYYGHQCGAGKMHGLTVEFGQQSGSANCPFYPSNEQYHAWMKEVSVGLMEFLLNAAEVETAATWEC